MIDAELTIKNYRCFPQQYPLKLQIRNGFFSFVGVNNSGKSTVLKAFYELRNVFQRLRGLLSGTEKRWHNYPSFSFGLPNTIVDKEEVFSNQTNTAIEITLVIPGLTTRKSASSSKIVDRVLIRVAFPTTTSDDKTLQCEASLFSGRTNVSLDKLGIDPLPANVSDAGLDCAHMISLCEVLSNTMYIGPYRNAIDHGGSKEYYDLSCGTDFVKTWHTLSSQGRKQNHLLVQSATEQIGELLGLPNIQISASKDQSTLHVVIDGKQYRLEELGAGVAHIVILILNCIREKPSIILIDEPELNLHPTMQTKLLQALGCYADGVVFATHSYGLARTVSDSMYTVVKKKNGVSEVKELEKEQSLPEQLGELSYSGYQDAGSGHILLVEGSTNFRVFRELLRTYDIAHKFVILPLGGNDMIKSNVEEELKELMRIVGTFRMFAIIDSEKKAADASLSKGRQSFADTCKALSIECLVLERRATENYFPQPAIDRSLGGEHKALGPYDEFKGKKQTWHKSDNWRIAQKIEKRDLSSTDLGHFIKNTLVPVTKTASRKKKRRR